MEKKCAKMYIRYLSQPERPELHLCTMESVRDTCLRTTEDVLDTLQLANIDETDLNGITQILQFTPDSNKNSDIKLLELDAHLLSALNEGDCLSFCGEKHEHAVLCTKNRTYDVKEAETSNSWMLVSNFKFAKETQSNERIIERRDVKGIFHTYFEVHTCKPKLSKLLVVLEPSSFKGTEYEQNLDRGTLYDWQRLKSEIQASEEELKRALTDYMIINIDGYFRLISFEYEARALTLMLDLIDENSWELDDIDKDVTYESLKELIPWCVFEGLFNAYTEVSEKTKSDGTSLYRYNEEKTCKFLAKVLLAACPKNDYKEFMEAWRIGTPEKMEPKESYLSGVALIIYNSSKTRKEVISFPSVNLSDNINTRFSELFKVKDKWTIDEITPYVSGLTTDKLNVNALLTRYTRCSKVNGIKYYSTKHGK